MTSRLVQTALLFALLSPALSRGDILVLTDGRTFEGQVTRNGQTVLIDLPYGTLRFPAHEVLEIQRRATPQEQYESRLGQIDPNDPNDLAELARWAQDHQLDREALALHERVVDLAPDNPQARKALGQIRIDDRWVAFDKAVELARGKLEVGQHRQLLSRILPELEQLADTPQQVRVVREVLAEAQLRSGRFAEAARSYQHLAETTHPPLSSRHAAIAKVLKANPDGMYIVAEPYPPGAGLLSGSQPLVKPGPASLAEPLVVRAALRQSAKKQIDLGRELIEAAGRIESTDPEEASATYARAEEIFDRADALVPRISHSYRVEIARRRISTLRKDVQLDAERFDRAMEQLGKEAVSPRAYRTMVQRLDHHLSGIRRGLDQILALARPYPRELVMEIKWAEADVKRIEAMRKILDDEIAPGR